MSESQGVRAEESLVLVVVLRRDPRELTPRERAAIESKFPGRTVTYQRTDPMDYREHAAQCQDRKPDVVLLPLERPLPALAMEQGVPHVAFVQGEYKRLLPLAPQFEPFNP